MAGVVAVVGVGATGTSWPWPEPRRPYANSVLPDIMIAAGVGLGRPDVVDQGLDLLGWLLDHEAPGGHPSLAPVGGGGPDDRRPALQLIEVAALAEACSRAAALTADDRWAAGVASTVVWLLGDNDAHAPMRGAGRGGGHNGLRSDGPHLNQGAELTLSLISTLQHGRGRVGAEQ